MTEINGAQETVAAVIHSAMVSYAEDFRAGREPNAWQRAMDAASRLGAAERETREPPMDAEDVTRSGGADFHYSGMMDSAEPPAPVDPDTVIGVLRGMANDERLPSVYREAAEEAHRTLAPERE